MVLFKVKMLVCWTVCCQWLGTWSIVVRFHPSRSKLGPGKLITYSRWWWVVSIAWCRGRDRRRQPGAGPGSRGGWTRRSVAGKAWPEALELPEASTPCPSTLSSFLEALHVHLTLQSLPGTEPSPAKNDNTWQDCTGHTTRVVDVNYLCYPSNYSLAYTLLSL